jgi:transposase-like protein
MANGEALLSWSPPAGGRWSEAVGRAMVEAFRRSGESLGAFARRHGMQAQRVKYWVDRFEGRSTAGRAAGRSARAACVTFAPLQVVEPAPPTESAPIEVVVGSAVVRVPAGFDQAHLSRVLAALAGTPC